MWTRPGLRSHVASVNGPLVAYLIHDQNMSSRSPRFARDTAIIEAKHGDNRRSRGVRFDQSKLEGNQAEIELRAGRRSNPANHYLRQMIRGGGPETIMRAMAAIAIPNKMTDRWNVRRSAAINDDWRVEVERWIAPVRELARASRLAMGEPGGPVLSCANRHANELP